MPGITRRRLLELGGVALAGGAATLVARSAKPRGGESVTTFDEYARFDGLGLADLVRRGEVSAGELLELALERLEAVNPRINAVVVRLEQQARRQIERGIPEGPLRGVPFLLKDLHAHLKGTVTTNGSRFFRDRVDQIDSELVRRHLRAGLVVFGKTASPEFGLTPSTESALHGATRNPWNREYTAGGSSGGSAAAVAAGVVPLAHASDGGGSIRIPASCCALFGLKPSRHRVPVGPPVRGEGWSGLSCHHSVTRSVRDSAALLDATSAPVPGSSFLAPPPERSFLAEVGASVGSLRIALVRRPFAGGSLDPECVRAVEAAAQLCQELGHRVEEAAPAIDFAEIRHAMAMVIIPVNVASALDKRAAELGRPVTQADVEATTWGMYQLGKRVSGIEYEEARAVLYRAGSALAEFQRDWDVLLSSVLGSPPVKLGILTLDDPEAFGEAAARFVPFTMLFNVTGQPSMSVPLHWTDDDLPVGVMFSGRYGDEATLFRLAAQLEEARPWAGRRPAV
jgi:Asp-tRNA(Asn)/Glu-tRNA(Gln) amidotransferase A subunit family amidase